MATGQLSDAPDVTDKEASSCTPLPVCRIAVESGELLIPQQGSEYLNMRVHLRLRKFAKDMPPTGVTRGVVIYLELP